MKAGDIVQEKSKKESNQLAGVIIEYESFIVYKTSSRGITKMDIDLGQLRHKDRGGLWRVLWANGVMESCWGSGLEVING